MKALSVRVPWWWAILHAGKDVENRDWPTKFRGRILLHASKWWKTQEVKEDFRCVMNLAGARGFELPYLPSAHLLWSSAGCIVGSIEIVDCVSQSNSPWFFGDYGFVLKNPIAFEKPIPFKGALGFFEVPNEITATVPNLIPTLNAPSVSC
jgi:hypothetical protein